MFVTCPKCSTKYQIPSEVYLPAGKKLKCSNCQHVFVYTPTEPEKPIEPVVSEPGIENIDPVAPVISEDEVFAAEPVEEHESDIPPAFTPVESEPDEFESVPKRGYGRVLGILMLLVFVALAVVLGILYRDELLGGMDFPFLKEGTQAPQKRVDEAVNQVVIPEAKQVPVVAVKPSGTSLYEIVVVSVSDEPEATTVIE